MLDRLREEAGRDPDRGTEEARAPWKRPEPTAVTNSNAHTRFRDGAGKADTPSASNRAIETASHWRRENRERKAINDSADRAENAKIDGLGAGHHTSRS